MKILYLFMGLACGFVGISGIIAGVAEWGEIMQFFILATLCFDASGRK